VSAYLKLREAGMKQGITNNPVLCYYQANSYVIEVAANVMSPPGSQI
jgi:hypothetical protein